MGQQPSHYSILQVAVGEVRYVMGSTSGSNRLQRTARLTKHQTASCDGMINLLHVTGRGYTSDRHTEQHPTVLNTRQLTIDSRHQQGALLDIKKITLSALVTLGFINHLSSIPTDWHFQTNHSNSATIYTQYRKTLLVTLVPYIIHTPEHTVLDARNVRTLCLSHLYLATPLH